MKTLEELVGQKLVIGIPGKKITPEVVRHFKEMNAGGLILYRINFESPTQLKKLISDLEEALGRKILVVTDHEGGRVVMFQSGVTVFPDNLAVGQTGIVQYAKEQGKIEAKELRRLGMDVNLGPVLDVLTESYSPNIGIRSYGKDWKLVTEMGLARISAMQSEGVSACAKHFPGKGHAPVDAHLGLPVIRSTWKEMEEIHLKPFRKAIEAGVESVMSSHPYYPNLDPEPNMIATFSKKIIYDYLRTELGFKGAIFSDDLEMGAIKEICSIEDSGVRATAAGHDILLVCHDLDAQKRVYNTLLEAYKEKKLSVSELEKSVERIETLKSKRAKRFESGKTVPEPKGVRLAEKICLESTRLLKLGKFKNVKGKKIGVIFPRFSSLAEKIMIEKEVLNEKKFVLEEFKQCQVKPEVVVVSIEPTEQELIQCVSMMREVQAVIYFCFDAHLYPSNKKLLDLVQDSGKTALVVLLRDPYDIEYIKEGTSCVTDFGWRACQIKAAIKKIK